MHKQEDSLTQFHAPAKICRPEQVDQGKAVTEAQYVPSPLTTGSDLFGPTYT